MDASAANKFMIFLLFSLSILLIVNGAGTSSFKQHIKPKHEHSERKLDSTTTTPAVFNPVTTIPGGTNPVIPPPSIVTIPSAPTVYNPVTTNPVVPAGSMTNYPAPLPPAVAGQSWCVVKGGATETALQAALDYACGIGGADCSALQVGASCYYPNTLENHASFAFNSYYQRNPVQTSCDFGGTALITNVNPSSGSCIYTPSTTIPSPATTGVAPPITTNPTTTPTPTTTGVSPITTNPTTGVSPITTNPTPTPTADSGIIPISFGTPPMVSSGGNPALGGGATVYGDGSSFPGNNSSSSSPAASTSSNLEPFIGSVIFVVTITITIRRAVFDI